ncbi:MAG: Ig-like domain-containing protein [Verrucomicrobia bacterium]|nr:Ig-like domain-containing protein [Verrucomicrobiota bacterium]
MGNNDGGTLTHTDTNVFQANTIYKFTIAVGTRSDETIYDIQDRMRIGYGATILADSRVADLGYVGQTGWQDITLVYTTPPSGAMIGQPITISYQRNHQTSADWAGYFQTSLDDAQLSGVVPPHTAPVVAILNPADNASLVGPSASLAVTFDVPVQPGTGNILIKRTSDDSMIATIDVTSDRITVAGFTATINPAADLPLNAGCYVQIDAGAFTAAVDPLLTFAGIADKAAWNFTTAGLAPNDNFANAIALPVTSGIQTGTGIPYATLETGEPIIGADNTVWFKWTAPSNGSYTISTVGSTKGGGGEWDAMLGIYTGSAVDALTALPGTPQDDDVAETMTVTVTAGTTYHIQAAGYGNEDASNIKLTCTFVGTGTIYGTWETANGASGSASADSNHNGVPNGVEFFMGGTAASPATLPALEDTAGTWTWTIPYDPGALATYKFQVSESLDSWTDVLPGDPGIAALTGPHRLRLTLPPGMRFCRLVVTAVATTGTLESLAISVNPKVLKTALQPNGFGTITLKAIDSNGIEQILPLSDAMITVKTKDASGGVTVAAVENGKIIPKDGGVASIEVVVNRDGREFKATTEVVVAPFYHDYHQTLVMKLFLGMEGDPVPRLVGTPSFREGHEVFCTFEEALEVIRKTDNLARGIPKIIYLVGWQKGGHDHGYPAWSEVNPRMKRPQDATALDSLRWLIREGRRYNTTVSLHINMTDAYELSPLWDEYVTNDCLAKDESGNLYSRTIQVIGEPIYAVVYPKEWAAGLAQRRIDRLIEMIPELEEGHTIHIDVFIAQDEGAKPLSLWHAKPENGGLTPERYVETQRQIFHYWRDRGFDVTGEGISWAHPPGEGFTGLQAMSWWYFCDTQYQMQIPEYLMARGRTDRGGDGDFRFGSSMHGEDIWMENKDTMPGFLGMFCRTTLPWYYLSRLERVKFEYEAVHYSDGVIARTEAGNSIIRKGKFLLRENDNLFVPALWNQMEIVAYSRQGYTDRSWQLPEEWRSVQQVAIHDITMEGLAPNTTTVPVIDGKIRLTLMAEQAISIVPAVPSP